jgi:multidrug efflux system membrane fusion protein
VRLPSFRRSRTVAILIGATLVGLVVLRTGRPPAAAARGTATGPRRVPVTVVASSRSDIPVRLAGLGSVVAFNSVTVRSRVDGQLMRVLFREGQFVKRGDFLAEIDPRPFRVQLEQAEGQQARDQAQLATARVDLGRYETLLAQDSIARQNVDAQRSTVKQLEASLQVDRAAIDNARLNLTYSRITAPISGRVGLRLVDAGNVVTASGGPGLVVITQVEPISVVFTLPEDALRIVLPRIQNGGRRGAGDGVRAASGDSLPVDVFDRAGATRLASGSVVTLDNEIDQTTGTVRLKAVFDNHDHALFPAQFVNVQLLADTERAQLVVPVPAIQQGPQGAFVYVVSDGKAAVRPVTVGITEGERTSIVAGQLNAGDPVITNGFENLRAGSAVEVRR